MEDKRTAFAILICMFVLLFSMEFVMAPYKNKQPAPPPQNQQSIGEVASQNQNNSKLPSVSSQQPAAASVGKAPPSLTQISASGVTTFEGNEYIVSISNLGARISSFKLKNYKAHLGHEEYLDLVTSTEGEALPVGIYTENGDDAFVSYKLDNISTSSGSNSFKLDRPTDVIFSGRLESGVTIKKIFKFNPENSLFQVEVELSEAPATGKPVWLEWNHFDSHYETNQRLDTYHYTLLGADNKVKLIQLKEVPAALTDNGAQQWASFGDKYFMATLIAGANTAPIQIAKHGNLYLTRIAGNDKQVSCLIYAGPKSHSDLAAIGHQLERNVDLGIFAFVALPLLTAIRFLYSLLGNYGTAIIALTLLIKAAFLPLTQASFKSMKGMQAIQPEMKALRERIQDPAKLNQEMMALYKKHGVNPMGGCLPMLIQLPVFLGLYNALNYSLELRHARFALWINDLSSPEHLDVMGIGIPVMVLLMGAAMFIQQWTTPSAADPQQKKIMMMMPIIFTVSFIIFPFPSGLVLYWLVNNIISIVQQMSLHGKGMGPLQGTIIASIAIFCFGHFLTLL